MGGTLVTAAACAIGLVWGVRVAGGVAAGATTGLAGLWFLSRFVPWMLTRQQPKTWMWIAWGLKVLVLLAFLYVVVVRLAVSPVGLGVGIGIVPAVLTADALRSWNKQT